MMIIEKFNLFSGFMTNENLNEAFLVDSSIAGAYLFWQKPNLCQAVYFGSMSSKRN